MNIPLQHTCTIIIQAVRKYLRDSLRTAGRIVCLSVSALCVTPASALSPDDQAVEAFAGFLEAVYQQRLNSEPELASKLGLKSNNDRWNDLSMAATAAAFKQDWLYLHKLHSDFDYVSLNKAAQLNYRAFEAELKLRIKRYSWRYQLSPLNQIVGVHLEIAGLLTKSHGIENQADALAYIKRLQSAGQPIDQFIAAFKDREAKGFFLPRSLMPRLLGAAESIIAGTLTGEEDNNILLADFKEKLSALDLNPKHKDRLLQQALAALETAFIPAYQRLISTFEEHQNLPLNDEGVWQMPDGAAFYKFLLEQFTTTNISADEVHSLGLQEVARIHEEMNAIKNTVAFKGDLKDFFQHLKSDPQFYYANTAQGRAAYLQQAEDFMASARARVNDLLPMTLSHPLQIRRIEAYREKSAPVGYYEGGSADGRIPGTVFLGMYDMASAAKYDLAALLSHEGIPGHHLQLSVMQSQPHVPDLRKYYVWWSNTAFTEGWALYAEYLAREIGLYDDPYSEFGRLAGELWRACRLVVDSGLHARRWSRQQAINYLNDNTASSQENNERAIDRYLAVPGQATAFKIGMMKILELRKQAQERLDEAFDLREFHFVVLRNGPLPLSLVEEEVEDWINSKQP